MTRLYALLPLVAAALAAPVDDSVNKRAPASSTTSVAPPPAGSTVVAASAPPSEVTPVANITTAGKFQWQIYKSCTADNKAQIQKAFQQSKWLSDAINSWVPTKDYQMAYDMYMGPDSSYDGDWLGDDNYRKVITNNIQRQQNLYSGKAYANANLYVYCNEDSRWWSSCTKNDQSAVIAYEQESGFFNNWYITFCPTFYQPSNYVEPLDQSIAAIKSGAYDAGVLDYMAHSQAGTFFHEMFHMSKLVTDPQALDYAYGPQAVYDQAKNKGTIWALWNADAYHMTGAAILAQQQFGLSQPPVPQAYLNIKDTSKSTFNYTTFLNDTVIDLTGSSFVPAGMTNGSTFDVNTDYWEVQSLTYSPLSTVAAPTSTSSLPVASSNLPNTVVSTPAPVSGGSAPTSKPTSKPTSTAGPTSTTSTSTQTPLETCHTQYKLVLDSFDIYGFDWDQSKLDAGGSPNSGNGLLTQLRGCSVITDWKFETMTVSSTNPYQWHASGETTIWQKTCIEHAMNSAGSPSESCSGSG